MRAIWVTGAASGVGAVVVDMLRARGAALGIRANAVLPGPVETLLLPDFRASMGAELLDWTKPGAGRFGAAPENAAVICFPLSREASWLNGSDLQTDGGLRAIAAVSPSADRP